MEEKTLEQRAEILEKKVTLLENRAKWNRITFILLIVTILMVTINSFKITSIINAMLDSIDQLTAVVSNIINNIR